MPNNEWGDFQTPAQLAQKCLSLLADQSWARILEPTCGIGRFLEASIAFGSEIERQGIERKPEHVEAARRTGFDVYCANIFNLDLGSSLNWKNSGPLLIIGNPPWVTNSQLGSLGSINIPTKSNVRKLNGFDAMTGASNFDIAEFILLKLMTELESEKPTLAFLVKTHVARNILSYAAQFNMPYSGFEIRLIDAKTCFNANVDACFFIARYDPNPSYTCDIYEDLDTEEPVRQMGVLEGQLVADLAKYRTVQAINGSSPIEWRSGIKHDAARVMEMSIQQSHELGLEEKHLFPLLKCSDLFRGRLRPQKCIIVPQRRLGEDTGQLRQSAPRLWSYLSEHGDTLDGRKSSIYRGQPRFSVFGLGNYTFAPFKIAISGLHKEARFVLLSDIDGKPIVVDDASYILPFHDGQAAALCHAILSSRAVSDLLEALVFWDAKRPITKKLLQRLDLRAAAQQTPRQELCAAAASIASLAGITVDRPWDTALGELLGAWGHGALGDCAATGQQSVLGAEVA